MIQTDAQRRWWFATHPEYGSQHFGPRNRRTEERKGKGDKVRPDEVDAYVDSMLPYADGPLAAFLESLRRNFGSEAAASDPTRLAGPVYTPDEAIRGLGQGGGGGGGGGAQPLFRAPVGGGGSSSPGARPPAGGAGSARPPQSAAPPGKAPEPGKWVDVNRGPAGLEHQSKMSGQPINRTGGQLKIKEYDVKGVKFDDYKNGNLIDYKGDYSKFIDKGGTFKEWFRGANDLRGQAVRQTEAAGGVPVIWVVPANQVGVFRDAIGNLPGIIIQGH